MVGRKSLQLELFREKVSNEFGGELLRGRRKMARPLSLRRPIHLVFRGEISKCRSLRSHQLQISKFLDKFARQFKIRMYRHAINSNHIHLLIKISGRQNFNNFVRAVAGVIALKTQIKWVVRPFTRLGHWGRDFTNTCAYVLQNELEAAGVIAYRARKSANGSRSTQTLDSG